MAPRRDKRKREGPSNGVRIFGNVVLFLFTLAVGALAVYLVMFPPGVID
ncbi:hypothetical protein BH20ACT5_BH20ACT5_07910 [soil metagenome]